MEAREAHQTKRGLIDAMDLEKFIREQNEKQIDKTLRLN